MEQLFLNDNWQMRHETMRTKITEARMVSEKKDGWLTVQVPCDVHEPLIKNGIIGDPAIGLNCFSGEWIEDKSWWFQKQFTLEDDFLQHEVIELYIEMLDIAADIVINNVFIGRQNSAFYAFQENVKRYLKAGENTMIIRLTTGLENVTEDEMMTVESPMNLSLKRDDPRRCVLRKPQYCFGWDWNPKVVSCGILSPVELRGMDEIAIRSAYLWTKSIEPTADVACHIEMDNLNQLHTKDVVVKVDIKFGEETALHYEKAILLQSGINYIDESFTIENPRLWWPNGAGEPNLYQVDIQAECNGRTDRYRPFQYGIRTFDVRQDVISDHEREFAFTVNGKKLYSKGANWVPADSIHTRISEEKYHALIVEAKNANFNTLRVWGGGLYERENFYHYCDENGLMVWQDFGFACAMYPDILDWFSREVEKEMNFQTKRLRSHPSLVMWCGNNEMHWGYDTGYSLENRPMLFGGQLFYNQMAPRIIYQNSPHTFYWNGSPYGGHDTVNSNDMGDAHIWFDCTFHKTDMEKRITPEVYDTDIDSKFVSEYGFIGACCKATTVTYYGGEEMDRTSETWKQHVNNQDQGNGNTELIAAAIDKHYKDAENLDIDDYLLYSSLCQGLIYEYSLEAFRIKPHNYGGLFWMYNDSWGELGWTIIDYYLKRKISFYYVKRAFEPVHLVLRKTNDSIHVFVLNDTAEDLELELDCGYFSYDGSVKELHPVHIKQKAFSRSEAYIFAGEEKDVTKGTYCAIPRNQPTMSTAILRQATFRECQFKPANVVISDYVQKGATASFTITSDRFAHAVHFNMNEDIHCSDEYFNLLPGEKKTIEIQHLAAELSIKDIVPVSVATV